VAVLWVLGLASDSLNAEGRLGLLAVLAGVAVIGIIAATTLIGDHLAPAAHFTRDAIGMIGLTALGAAILGADRAWIFPLTSTLLAWKFLSMPSPPSAPVLEHLLIGGTAVRAAEPTAAMRTSRD
jgi:hypothetical protein